MSIDDAVDLVVYAFEHGNPGEVFVQKAPAATIETLARALKKLFKADNEIRIIGKINPGMLTPLAFIFD
jgi:UDP-glucose 4-epimerase